ncbi:hypothetical protein [Escherichia coli]|uniref:hypothetical protein n=1 Tax=Escherichia coli TaxID=562 RepID=UPI00388F363D
MRSNGPEGGGQDARHKLPASNKAKGHPSGWPFCIGAEKMPDATLARLIQLTQAR